MKKTISILLLSLFVYNTIGFLALHPLLSIYYKHLGKLRADKHQGAELVEILTFYKEDIINRKINFSWIHSREFRYNGDLYDIAKKQETDEKLILYCINDTKEKQLEEEFKKKVDHNSRENKNHQTTGSHISSLISEPACEEEISLNLDYECNYINRLTDFYKSFNIEIPSPPPRLV